MRIGGNILPLLLLTLFVAGGTMSSVSANDGEPLTAAAEALAPPVARAALDAIPDPGRKLLALRSYLRARRTLESRWSWTEAEIAAFRGSPEQEALLGEVAAIAAHFADAHPGYEIYANTKVRSLDVQLERWNTNKSVGRAAAVLLAAFTDRFGGAAGPGSAGARGKAEPEIAPDKLRTWLVRFRLPKRPTFAAPGLTAHGQAGAIDFQIRKDGRIVAGARSDQIETVWRAEGWAKKLKASIDAAGPSFSGPLNSPDEPWHYDYHRGSPATGFRNGD